MIIATIPRAPRAGRVRRSVPAEIIVHPSAPQTVSGKLLERHPLPLNIYGSDPALGNAQAAAILAVIGLTSSQPRDRALAQLQDICTLTGA